MLVYGPHLKALGEVLSAAEPAVLLPSLHSDYLRELLTVWLEESEARGVFLFEPGWGASQLAKGVLKPGSCGHGESLTDWLGGRIHDVPGRTEAAGTSAPQRLYWLTSTQRLLSDELAQGALAALCRRICAYELPWRVLLDDPGQALPAQLAAWTRQVELKAPRPDSEDDGDFPARVLREQAPRIYAALSHNDEAKTDSQDDDGKAELRQLTRQVQGLDAASINLVFAEAARSLPEGSDKAGLREFSRRVNTERDRLLKRASGLVLERVGEDELLGMNRLQRHLEYVDVLFADAADPDAAPGPRPRGVLLAGLPGCGKSLAARIAAKKLQVPLLRLDVGSIMGRYLGESEANLRRALDAAEASAPCVLWVDEIEKALGGLDENAEGGGTGGRILAYLLSWMQDHPSQVYLFATANAVAQMPPALLRRGRFDELWRVMLPTEDERLAIIWSKLRKVGSTLCDELRGAAPPGALKTFVNKSTKAFTGADLESLVNEAWSRARVQEKKLTLASLKDVLTDGFEPMSKQFKDKIEAATKELDKHGFRDVSCLDRELPPPVPDARRARRGDLVGVLRSFWESPKGTRWQVREKDLVLRFEDAQPDEQKQRSLGCEHAQATGSSHLGLATLRHKRNKLFLKLPQQETEITLMWSRDAEDQSQVGQ